MTETILTLGRSWASCPSCWRNFVMAVKEECDIEEGIDLAEEIIDEKLEEYDAFYHEDKSFKAILTFRKPELLSYFLLKWS